MCAEHVVGATCGRLLVHVQRGKRFINSGKIHIFSFLFQFIHLLEPGFYSLLYRVTKFLVSFLRNLEK